MTFKNWVVLLVYCLQVFAFIGVNSQNLVNTAMHEHTTFKNYVYAIPKPQKFNYTIDSLGGIDNVLANKQLLDFVLTKKLVSEYQSNWRVLEDDESKMKGLKEIADWGDSHWKNYSQADFDNLLKGKFKFVITSITPLEKPNMQSGFQLRQNHKQNRINTSRLLEYSKAYIPHWEEFVAEYYYTLLASTIPYSDGTQVKIIDTRKDFDEVERDPSKIGMLFSAEGINLLHGAYYYMNRYYLITPKLRYRCATDDEWKEILREKFKSKAERNDPENIEKMNALINRKILNDILHYTDSLKNLTHRIHFVTGAHFSYNDMFGHDKVLDKEQKRNLVQALSASGYVRNKLFAKDAAGIWPYVFQVSDKQAINNQGPVDQSKLFEKQVDGINIGKSALDALHDIENIQSENWDPIYFDLKHADELTFLEYLAYRQHIKDTYQKTLPLFVSHVAVNGENLKVSLFTSQSPLYDRYKELTKNDPVL